jgi:hypothetical protein
MRNGPSIRKTTVRRGATLAVLAALIVATLASGARADAYATYHDCNYTAWFPIQFGGSATWRFDFYFRHAPADAWTFVDTATSTLSAGDHTLSAHRPPGLNVFAGAQEEWMIHFYYNGGQGFEDAGTGQWAITVPPMVTVLRQPAAPRADCFGASAYFEAQFRVTEGAADWSGLKWIKDGVPVPVGNGHFQVGTSVNGSVVLTQLIVGSITPSELGTYWVEFHHPCGTLLTDSPSVLHDDFQYLGDPRPTIVCPVGNAGFVPNFSGCLEDISSIMWFASHSPDPLAPRTVVVDGSNPGPAGAEAFSANLNYGWLIVYPSPGFVQAWGGDTAYFTLRITTGTGTIESSPTRMKFCPADFDCSRELEVADIFAFLNAWFAADPRTDFDGVSGLQVADIFAFLNAWFAGCS